MANMEAKFEARQDTAEKIVEKFGFDQPSAFDLVDRNKYADDDSYLDAVVKMDMELNSPAYQEARRRLKAEYRERQEAELEERIKNECTEREAQFAEIRSGIELSDDEKKESDARASAMAHYDLACGKIDSSELGSSIARYAEKFSGERKDSKAASQVFNNMFRDILRKNMRGRRQGL